MTLQIGEIVADKYRIVRLLGQGGMGEVYEGENLRIRRRVAIKTLHTAVSSKPDAVQRFEREAQAAGRIGSAHIVEVLDLGDLPDGSRYMVMEFLEGSTLGERIVSRGRLPSREAALIVAELCEGLGAAHNTGIIHRDLKPANVFLATSKQHRRELVKILDFGVSKFSVLGDDMSMTSTGAVVGTPYYMSPEQAKGAKFIDARSDLYSVGVILYEAITGHVPFNAQTFNELIFKIALETPPPAESFVPDLDPRMASIIKRAMAREVNARFQSAAELKQTLEGWVGDIDRGIPIQASSPVGGWYPPQTHPMPPPVGAPLGGTQIMEAAAIARPARARSKSSTAPILVAAGILGFGVVSIAAALMFHKKPTGESDAPAFVSTAKPKETSSASEPASIKTADPASTNTVPAASLSDLPPAATSAPVVNVDPTIASGNPTATPVAASPNQPGAPSYPTNFTNPGGARTSTPPQPTAKPGGRSISGSLE